MSKTTFQQLFIAQSKMVLWKTLLEKEKMLVESISSISNNIFYPNKDNFHDFCHI